MPTHSPTPAPVPVPTSFPTLEPTARVWNLVYHLSSDGGPSFNGYTCKTTGVEKPSDSELTSTSKSNYCLGLNTYAVDILTVYRLGRRVQMKQDIQSSLRIRRNSTMMTHYVFVFLVLGTRMHWREHGEHKRYVCARDNGHCQRLLRAWVELLRPARVQLLRGLPGLGYRLRLPPIQRPTAHLLGRSRPAGRRGVL